MKESMILLKIHTSECFFESFLSLENTVLQRKAFLSDSECT